MLRQILTWIVRQVYEYLDKDLQADIQAYEGKVRAWEARKQVILIRVRDLEVDLTQLQKLKEEIDEKLEEVLSQKPAVVSDSDALDRI